jgi:class 3 adenylate cyclase
MSFRLKLFLAMMLVVGAITAATLLGTQRTVERAYEQIFEQQFRNQFASFTQLQEARLANIRAESLSFVKSIRVIAAFSEMLNKPNPDIVDFDKYCRTELLKQNSAIGEREPLIRYLDAKGTLLIPDPAVRGASPRDLDAQMRALAEAMHSPDQQQAGYLAGAVNLTNALHEVVLTKVIDPADESVAGAIILAFPLSHSKTPNAKDSTLQSGLYLDGTIYWSTMPWALRATIASMIKTRLGDSKINEDRFTLTVEDKPHTIFFRALARKPGFPLAYQVCVYSLEEAARVERDLRSKILLFGALAMIAALAISFVLSHGLSGPINELVKGTREVEKGNLDTRVTVRSRDEVGQLAESFNQMTAGLALKEKYRSVLDMVADKRIADDLIHGKIELGGEERNVAVLFCDIRGFTGLTQNMEPPEVIKLLNEHFTPLTRVVYEHHGVVDKFVGDMIMAIFGAPTSHGNDPLLAAQCALRMIEEREKLNADSKYKISIGIGVASGKAVAGRMGAKNRLNYTVLGPRVNLASRLCSFAGPMEVVIDEVTYDICKDRAKVLTVPELRLKGFSEPIPAYKLTSLSPA